MHAAARWNFLAQFVAVVECRAAKDFVQPFIVAYLDMIPEVLPVHPRGLGCDQSGADQEQHQENAPDANAARRLA